MNLKHKTLAELHYIAEDAYLAAQAMMDHDEKAEVKYLDQMNDAINERYRRFLPKNKNDRT